MKAGGPGWLGVLAWVFLMGSALAAEEEGSVDPNAVLEIVRGSYVGEDFEVDGQLRVDSGRLLGGSTREPFKLTGQPGYIQFAFLKSGDVYRVDLAGARPVLREAKGGQLETVPPERYGEQVQGIPITYEDLAMRYIYWPGTRVLGEKTILGDKCWIVEVANPGVGGPYSFAHLWIGQKSGAILQMDGLNAEGKRLRHFEVVSIHTVEGVWMFKVVRIESYNPETGKREGERVYLETENPRKSGSPMRKR
jgi:hypothetical protein